MADYRAADTQQISLRVGRTATLESLRQSVVPPYIMLMPFFDVPPEIEILSLEGFPGEGVHGCVYTIRAIRPGTGQAEIGFKDLRSGKITHKRSLTIVVEP